jgi:hypothetical protein
MDGLWRVWFFDSTAHARLGAFDSLTCLVGLCVCLWRVSVSDE